MPPRMEQRERDGINLRLTALTRRRRGGMRRVLAAPACMPEHRWPACGASSVRKTPAKWQDVQGRLLMCPNGPTNDSVNNRYFHFRDQTVIISHLMSGHRAPEASRGGRRGAHRLACHLR